MKELSIEEKAKRYDEAIDKIADAVEASTIERGFAEWLFPELKENEDDGIREWLIGYFNQYIIDGMPQVFDDGLNVKDVIAWLEKQGKPNPQPDHAPKNAMEAIKEERIDNANKVEPKPAIKQETPEENLGIDSATYNKIIDECIYGKQNPAWSEEDEEMFDAIIADIKFTQKAHNHEVNQVVYEREIDWLKLLKNRMKRE